MTPSVPDVAAKFQSILAEELAIPEPQITADTTFSELNLDSQDQLEIALAVEEEFGIAMQLLHHQTVAEAIVGIHEAMTATHLPRLLPGQSQEAWSSRLSYG